MADDPRLRGDEQQVDRRGERHVSLFPQPRRSPARTAAWLPALPSTMRWPSPGTMRHSRLACRIPLSPQKVQNHAMLAPNPNIAFIAAVSIRPPASRMEGEVRAPSTPLRNLEKP